MTNSTSARSGGRPDHPLTQLELGALDILNTLRTRGHDAYWAGGCVRDKLLGRTPKDIDIVTSARPDQIAPLFSKTVAIGKAFGVIGVVRDGALYEVATFRKESLYSDGRRPDEVTFTDAREDAQRRDFTINALFYDPIEGQVLDFVGGREDMRSKQIRAVGDPGRRFQEDHLRMLRGIRFASTLDFTMEAVTWNAIVQHAHLIARISPERIRDELVRILTESVKPGFALRRLHDAGLLPVILPEVDAMVGVEQPPEFHPEGDVFTHVCMMLDLMQQPTTELALAVLLHDVGKPPTARVGPGRDGRDRIRFDTHDKKGADMAERILRRLRFPNALVSAVVQCVRNHMRFMHVREMRRAKLRALIASPTFDTELELHRLDCLGSHGDLTNYHFLKEYRETLQDEPALPDPWVRGDDLLALGVPEGPEIGRLLREAYAQQLEGHVEDRAALLDWLKTQIKKT